MGVARGSGETACSQHKRGGEIETSDVGVRTEVFSAAISKSKSVDFATPENVSTQARSDRRRAFGRHKLVMRGMIGRSRVHGLGSDIDIVRITWTQQSEPHNDRRAAMERGDSWDELWWGLRK